MQNGNGSKRVLKIVSGPAAGRSIELQGVLLVGRSDADLTIPDPEVSHRHALVRATDAGVVVEDLGSRNGTFVDGRRISGAITLAGRSTIRLGSSQLELEGPRAAPTVLGRAVPLPEARPRSALAAAAPEPPRSWLKWMLVAGLVAAAGATAAVVVLATGGADTKTRALTANLTTALLSQTPTEVTFGGTVRQSPGGDGAVAGGLKLQGDLSRGKPVPVRGEIVLRFDGGSINTTVAGTATPQPDRTVDIAGTGMVDGGTDEFEGATGSFTFTDAHDAQNPTIGHPKIRGTIEY
jgi:FHA domain